MDGLSTIPTNETEQSLSFAIFDSVSSDKKELKLSEIAESKQQSTCSDSPEQQLCFIVQFSSAENELHVKVQNQRKHRYKITFILVPIML